MDGLARLAPHGHLTVFGDHRRDLQFDLLSDTRRLIGRSHLITTMRTFRNVIFEGRIKVVLRNKRPLVPLMSRLSASFAFFPPDFFLPEPARESPAEGRVMSLDGGLEEFREFFFAAASCDSNSAIRASS